MYSDYVRRLAEHFNHQVSRKETVPEGLKNENLHHREYIDEVSNSNRFMPSLAKGTDPNVVEVHKSFSVNNDGKGVYDNANVVEIPMAGYDLLKRITFIMPQGAITGASAATRFKNVFDMFKSIGLWIDDHELEVFPDKSISTYMDANATYQEMVSRTGTIDHSATAFGSPANWTFSLDRIIGAWGLKIKDEEGNVFTKRFPCGLCNGKLRFEFNLKALASTLHTITGTPAGGLITGWRAEVVYETGAGKYISLLHTAMKNYGALHVPYWNILGSKKFDVASTSTELETLFAHGNKTRQFLICGLLDGEEDTTAGKTTKLTSFSITQSGSTVYPTDSKEELESVNKYHKRFHYHDNYCTGGHAIKVDFGNSQELDPAKIDGTYDFSQADGLCKITSADTTAQDYKMFCLCHADLYIESNGETRIRKE